MLIIRSSEGPSYVDGGQMKDASCVDACKDNDLDLKYRCESSSFKGM